MRRRRRRRRRRSGRSGGRIDATAAAVRAHHLTVSLCSLVVGNEQKSRSIRKRGLGEAPFCRPSQERRRKEKETKTSVDVPSTPISFPLRNRAQQRLL